ncbi:geranylgeranyl pyrophosphate synthetase [Monosporozyma unispora]|nr:geranylgeranyl pyrophosphate synthetase [Kazachstania unispora]
MDPAVIKALVDQPLNWDECNETILEKPYLHISQQQGKKFRSKLIQIFNQFYQLPESVLTVLQEMIEILHNSSLMIDDIEDNSVLRRGIKTSHLVFGIPMTINSANYMYFIAMNLLPQLLNEEGKLKPDVQSIQVQLYKIFNEELCNLHRGQGLDIYWRDNNVIPTEEQYFNMVINKTGGLFRLTIRLMALLSKIYTKNTVNFSLVPLCNMLGVIYQIRDDYLNLSDKTMTVNKGFAEDITEGKLSFPIIHGINYEKKNISKDKHFILTTVMSRTTDTDIKLEVIKFLKDESGSLDYAKETVKNLAKLLKDGSYLPNEQDTSKDVVLQLHFIIDHLSAF